ncbi:recombinase family protein [Escherichia coli]|nr:recombinase family protein [Escherichia coli]
MGHRAAIYCRVSTADQSCERREFDLRAFAGCAGYDVVGIFKETGSGTKLDRAERKSPALAQSRQIDAIWLSRWGRSTLICSIRLNSGRFPCRNGMAFDLRWTLFGIFADQASGSSQLAVAKARGKRLGRQAGVRPKSDRLCLRWLR